MSIALIILAAGQGTRMNSDLPKVLHKLAGAPLLWHALKTGTQIGADKTVIVVGHGGDLVEKSAVAFDPNVEIVWQNEQNGTGHAVQQAASALDGFDGDAVILYGDTPFIQPETLETMLAARKDGAAITVLGFNTDIPGGYGRLITDGVSLDAIVEAKDATDEQRAVTLCNSGVICAPAPLLFDLLSGLDTDNASGELYLTDIVALARERDLPCRAIICDESETLGVNSRVDLAAAEAAFQTRARALAMENGVTMAAPETVYFSYDTTLGRDVNIEPNVYFGPGVTVENTAEIRAFSHLEGCHISTGCIVGPYARLRPGAELAGGVKIGNFVEIKAAQIETGAKVNHLTYVGDARVGEGTNIGAGTIFCNYDGVNKHHTDIGKRVFIGSNSALVAPITIADDAFIATGTVVTENVDTGDMAIARPRQINKKGLGKKLMDRLRAAKNK